VDRLQEWLNNPETQTRMQAIRARCEADQQMRAFWDRQYVDLAEHLEEMASAYCKRCDIPPDEVVLVTEPDYGSNYPGRMIYRYERRDKFR
jgi:hypothetical protein